MKPIIQTIAFSLLLLVWSCDEQDLPLDCPSTLSCTEIFVTFHYAPSDNQGEPILLDTYFSRNLDNGETYDFANTDNTLDSGSYTVITDAQIEEIKATGTTIRFIGIKDEEVIIEQDFVIGHDCCHIVPLEGPGVD